MYKYTSYLYVVKACDSMFSRCLYFSSQAFARKVERLAIAHWKEVGLAPSHAYLLLLTLEDPGIQPGKMAEQVQLSPSTVTRLLDKLENQKLLVRTTEGKQTNVYPTPKAKQLYPRMQEILGRFYQSYQAALGGATTTQLVEEMNTLTDRL